MASKVKGPKLYFSRFGGEQPIPPEFIAAMERTEETQPVPNDEGPEPLSGTIIESNVTTNRTGERVRKTVKKKAGNITLLAIRTNDQGQPVQVTRTLYPTGTPAALPTVTTEVAVHDLGNGWSIEEASVAGSYIDGVFTPGYPDGPGQTYDQRLDIVPSTFVDTTVTLGTGIGTNRKTIDPKDYVKAHNRTFTANTTALDAFSRVYAETDDLGADLPRVLLGINVTWDATVGNGQYSETATGDAVGTNVRIGFTLQGSGQSSASVLANIEPQWQVSFGKNRPVRDYFFLVAAPVTLAAIKTRLETLTGATVNFWPNFILDQPVFTLVGQKISFSAKATASFTVNYSSGENSYASSEGTGLDYDIGSTVRSVTLPECIHGAITLSGATNSATAATEAIATTPSGTNFPGASADTGVIYGTASGAVSPASLSATSIAAIPSSGLYVKNIRSEDYEMGYVLVRARLVDFADL